MSSKRRASSDMAVPGPKKRRQIDDNKWPEGNETAEGTRETGLKLLDSLRRSQDKSGRLVSTQFLTLPDKTDTEYYKKTPLPISFEEIQAKLEGFQYANMTGLESDLKRMVQNAKEYNSTGSMVYEDAERIRKALSNFMPKNNPAYRDQDYRAIATPVPASAGNLDHGTDISDVSVASGGLDTPQAPMTIKLRVNGSTSRRRGSRVNNGSEDAGRADVDLRQQQLEIVEDMIKLRDPEDENLEITLEFYEKPSKREYPDYYQTISHPTALKDIQKSASNNKFPDWESFITEAEYLWSNALTYNEEGSFINNNANKLKDWFIDRISSIPEARDFMPPKKLKLHPPKKSADSVVQQPSSSTRIKFTNTNKDVAEPGITVDEEARRRQHEHVQAASQGQPLSPSSVPAGPSPQSPTSQAFSRVDQPRLARAMGVLPGTPVTVEDVSRIANQQVPEPVDETRIMTMDETISAHEDAEAAAQITQPVIPTSIHPPQPQIQTTSALHTTIRAPGKTKADSLWLGLLAATQIELALDHPFSHCFGPDPHYTVNAEVRHLHLSQAALYFSLGVSELCSRREKYRVVYSLDWQVIESHMEDPYVSICRVSVPLGVHCLRVDIIAHVNDLGTPAPIWPEERFDFERFEFHMHVHPDDWRFR